MPAGLLTAAALCQAVAALQPAGSILVDESLTSGTAYWEVSKVLCYITPYAVLHGIAPHSIAFRYRTQIRSHRRIGGGGETSETISSYCSLLAMRQHEGDCKQQTACGWRVWMTPQWWQLGRQSVVVHRTCRFKSAAELDRHEHFALSLQHCF
jgi:hypothetical protein